MEADGEHACYEPYVDEDPWPGEGSDEPLLSAAKQVDVAPPVYGDKAKREGPPTDHDSFERLCRAILEAAQRPVPLSTLTRVVGERLQVRERWDEGLPDDWVSRRPIAASSAPTSPLAFLIAKGIWEELDENERGLLPFLDAGEPAPRVPRAASAWAKVQLMTGSKDSSST